MSIHTIQDITRILGALCQEQVVEILSNYSLQLVIVEVEHKPSNLGFL